ncbi:MAG: inositol monophosphatase family protein [Patescibacteria group bacterium]
MSEKNNKISNGVNDQTKNIAIEAARKAGRVLLREYANFDRSKIELKSSHEILTKADLDAEKIIIKAIKKSFPSHQILSEEAGWTKNKSDYLWIIDPLDGTTNFSMRNPLWSISIALAYNKEIILGIIFIPVLNELYWAEKNKGAYLNNKKIKVSKISKGKIINTFCHGHTTKAIKKAIKYYTKQKLNGLDCRQLGSAALELAYVACGRVETIVIPETNPWDVAAGALLVREAGGKVTDFSGRRWSLDNRDIAASNGQVHKSILNVLKKI